jgi:hypothetical protein
MVDAFEKACGKVNYLGDLCSNFSLYVGGFFFMVSCFKQSFMGLGLQVFLGMFSLEISFAIHASLIKRL